MKTKDIDGPIRILQVIGFMDQGGAEAMIMNLYRKINREKVQFDFVEFENDGAFFDEEILKLGGKIYHCPWFSGKNFFKYKKWWKVFFDLHKEYRLVHGHVGRTAAIYLGEAKKHNLITIAHSHNTFERGPMRILYKTYSFPTRYVADYFFMCSKQAGIDRFGRKTVTRNDRAFLIPNAIDTEKFQYDLNSRTRKRNELSVSDETLLIGHVGRFVDQKNHFFLIDIFSEIVKMHPSSKLLLVGKGELRLRVEEKIAELGLKDKVILTGAQRNVDELMDAMDVMVFPSKYEGLPVTLVEAQCNGLPCVISDKIPEDSIQIKDLVVVRCLTDNSSDWARAALSCKISDRSKCADIIKETAFNINNSAKWMEEFYLEKSE